MIEAFILTLDVFCMVWICWRMCKVDERPGKEPDLGIFSYKPSQDP